jgi:hypothetical protein
MFNGFIFRSRTKSFLKPFGTQFGKLNCLGTEIEVSNKVGVLMNFWFVLDYLWECC